jgi:ABC-type tungstate transport system substrate-binding protein
MSNTNGGLGVGEPSVVLLLQDSYFAGALIQTIGFGEPMVYQKKKRKLTASSAIQFLVYGIVMRILWSRRKFHPFTNWALMIHSTAMCLSSALSTLGIVVAISETFIHHKEFPGGTMAYIGESSTAWFNGLVMAGFVAGNVLGDFVLVSRQYWYFS